MAVVHSGFKEILLKRISYIILWHVIILSSVLQFIASINLNNDPFSSTLTWLKNLIKPRFFRILLFQLFLSVVCVITERTQYLKTEQYDNVSRFRYLCRKLSPNNLYWFFMYILQGILSIVIYFTAFKDVFDNLYDRDTEFTETIIILICNAVWINVMFFSYHFLYRKSFKYFSVIQHNNCLSMPMIIIAAKNASIKSFYYSSIFLLLYLLKGHSFCTFVCHLFNVKCNISYTTVFNSFTVYYLWLLNAFIFFNNSILKLLFDIFLTGRISFPISSSTASNSTSTITLKDALAADNVPLLQYLAHYDLNIVSQFDKSGRKQIFSLSYPGGHPYTWQAISNEAFKLITDTINQLEKITAVKKENAETKTQYQINDRFNYTKMRQLSPTHFVENKHFNAEGKLRNNFVAKILSFVKTIRIISYVTEDMTEKQLECALQHYQTLSLACYSLSNLAAASRAEDEYGVIQQDLSKIISLLLQLNATLNKLVVIINKKPNSPIHHVKKFLIHTTKSSLYKMSVNFGSYVKDLSLSSEDEKLFNNFISFKS